MFTFLLVVQAIIGALLVTVILMQRSEGGGLTSGGGSPGGLMSARGASDFLTRSTAVLATLFIAMSILLAVLAATRSSSTIDTSLARDPAPVQAPATQPDQAAPPVVDQAPANAGEEADIPLAQ
ncbi:preprotein translocase subunit SecG [Stakelama tenebrarum]|uniref:Protein-export membrane protein SecG n=1 Tax=Stakelama tenebrarum TaxID=2711215 RepID=A0A6G6YBF6_9SPHN|nr:preprotein translocase subunit SecG [Sphingosinithalassobacter tenebrarum]QIG81916.1 preprotein translocase subunit SecG [Sphingosinithalassobacter tenebrarum]